MFLNKTSKKNVSRSRDTSGRPLLLIGGGIKNSHFQKMKKIKGFSNQNKENDVEYQ